MDHNTGIPDSNFNETSQNEGTHGGNVDDVVMVDAPFMQGMNDNLHRVSELTRALGRPANTSKAYNGKRAELEQYLEHVFAHDRLCYILNEYKVYRFVFYQCAREKRLNRRGQRATRGPHFDIQDYTQVMQMYDSHTYDISNNQVPLIHPQNGLKFQALRQYKAVIKEYFQEQLQHQKQGWEFVWTP